MVEFKFKPKVGVRYKEDLKQQLKTRSEVIKQVVEETVRVIPPENKEKKSKTPAKKVVYISKGGSRAVFDSIGLCAKIFGVDVSTIKYRIEHPDAKVRTYVKNDFWLKGGKLEYINN